MAPGLYLPMRFTSLSARSRPAGVSGGSIESVISEVSFSAWRTRMMSLRPCAAADDAIERVTKIKTRIESGFLMLFGQRIRPLSNNVGELGKWILGVGPSFLEDFKAMVGGIYE